MELLPLVCLCLLSCSGDARDRVLVTEGSDAGLPCSLSTEEDIRRRFFHWRKDDQKDKKEVFLYDAGIHYNNGRAGQDEQFKGRVSHFQDQLQNGNASIKIHKTKMADSGIYSCIFPSHPRTQTFYIKLVVGASEPSVTIVRTDDGMVLQCEVLGASPKPKVEWKESSGNVLPVKDLKETERGGSYDIVLQAALTKTDTFRCYVTEKEINYQMYAEIDAAVPGWSSWWIVGGAVVIVGLVAVIILLIWCRCRGSTPNTTHRPRGN